MKVKGGCQVPNGPFTPADVVEVFGEGVFIIMQGELDKLPELRDKAPGAFIVIRFYLPNWYAVDAFSWADECWKIWTQVNESDEQKRRNCDLADAFTWANEQNLKDESGGLIGSSPGDMIKPGHYEIIRDWNLNFLDRWSILEATANLRLPYRRVFPALAMGNSDDQDDGGGVGLEILQPVIDRCHFGAIHPYWQPGKLEDEWVGLGRIKKQLNFFKNLPIIVTETGNFAVTAEESPREYQRAYYLLQGNPRIFGFCYFIFADPTKHHQANDMSRNAKIYDYLKSTIQIERVEPDIPKRVVVPIKQIEVGYQVWQYNALPGISNYQQLEEAMNQVGAGILSDKFADSDAFQAMFDNSPMAVNASTLVERAEWCRQRGFMYIPWHVPRAIPINGDAFVGAAAEGKFVGDVTRDAGLPWYVSDLEFYEDFFGYALASKGGTSWFADNGDRNKAARLHYEAVRNANPNLKIILQPDPRQDGLIDIARMVKEKLIDAILYQSYANFFMQQGDTRDHKTIIQDSINKAKRLEIPWGICLYCEKGSTRDSTPEQAEELLAMATEAGATWVFVYKAPITARLEPIIKRYAGNVEMPEETSTDTIDKIEAEAWKAGDTLQGLKNRAHSLGYPWFGDGLEGLGTAVKALAAKNTGGEK
jgi:hypothetical protein